MTQILRQSTAVDVLIGPFVDATNGYDAETGISPAVKLSKNGQALGAKNDATTPVHDADGYYNCEFDTTDTGTVGTLVLSVIGNSTSLPVRHEYQVVEQAVYDAMYVVNAEGPLQATTAGRKLDITSGGAAGIDWGNIENKSATVDLSATDLQLVDTITTYTGNTKQTGDVITAINDLANGTDGLGALKSLIDTLDTVADGIQTDLSNGTDGLGALKTLIDTLDTVADGIQTDLSNGTDGLGALKTLIDAVNTDLANGTDGLGALKTLIDTVNSDLANGTDGLGALKTLIDALNDITAAAVMTAQMTESYAADGVAPTPAQALLMILALLSEFAINSTTLTAKKLDGSSTAGTFTLSDATNPTSITRAS